MAEFQEVARLKRKMCNTYQGKNCYGCPLNDSDRDCGILSVRFADITNGIKRLEDKIMQWAAENPEPVYETWGQYFRRYYGLEYCKGHEMLLENIPAEIAQKLGLKPKEVYP